ncbi:MAG: hypothetical protein H6Q15_1485 [Bacteroidetes bacterium]|nr:hypothetical protein [Bacteroidota bacterium]
MKKLLLSLILIVPLLFSGCSSTQKLMDKYTGNMSLKTGGQEYKLYASNFYIKDGKTYVVASNGDRTITISFKGTTPGVYPLGMATNLQDIAALASKGLGGILDADNALMHVPTEAYKSTYLSLTGNLVITEYTSGKIVGTFSGVGINKDLLSVQGILNILINNSMDFSGSFSAVKL